MLNTIAYVVASEKEGGKRQLEIHLCFAGLTYVAVNEMVQLLFDYYSDIHIRSYFLNSHHKKCKQLMHFNIWLLFCSLVHIYLYNQILTLGLLFGRFSINPIQ